MAADSGAIDLYDPTVNEPSRMDQVEMKRKGTPIATMSAGLRILCYRQGWGKNVRLGKRDTQVVRSFVPHHLGRIPATCDAGVLLLFELLEW